MPRQLRPNDRIKDYTIEAHLNTGAMANAFSARDSRNEKVFLKSYKSPTCAVSWYNDYVDYQKELKRRLEHHTVGKFCVKLVDQFEFTFGVPTFFQVFEFVHGGQDLEQILAKLRRNPNSLDWNQRHILAKVMMAAIYQLHDAKIVHGDLKPPNLQLFKDPSITAGYQLKLIDMDFSVLSDRRAPWHGHSSYVGTPGYFSPEHLAGGDIVPLSASDVFTCGLILYELLAQGHPYRFDDNTKYYGAVKSFLARKPVLLGRIDGNDEKTEALVDALYKCLSPKPSDRPSAQDVHLALNGRYARPTRIPIPDSGKKPVPPRVPMNGADLEGALILKGPSTAEVKISVSTAFGKRLLKTFGEDAQFADDLQFWIMRKTDGWWITPATDTKNLTLINGEPVQRETQLTNGDLVSLGSRSVGSRRVLPMTIAIS